MKMPFAGMLTIAALLLMALATGGCESTPLLAPTGASLTLLANPVTAAPDPARDPTENYYFSTIFGQLLDTATSSTTSTSTTSAATSASPLVGVTITFSSSGGNLRFNACEQGLCTLDGELCPGGVVDCVQPAPQPLSVETDSAGVVQVSVAVTDDDPANITVTALSGTINQNISFGNPLGAPNDDPQAEIGVSPDSPADASVNPVTVTFFSESTDPDGDEITCYDWTIRSSVGGVFSVRGPGEDIVERSYSAEQSLDVLLRVTDDPDASTVCTEDSPFSPNVDTLSGYLVCTNTAPTAAFVLAPPDTQPTTVSYLANGSSSTDGETTALSRYEWDCGNGQEPTGVEVTCTYTRSSSIKFYDIELVVTDNSTEDGCELESEPAVQNVTIPALEEIP